MSTLAIILSRAGSKGLRHKAILPLCGRPVITYTFDHAKQSALIDATCVTTDSPQVAELARRSGIEVIDRPPELARDDAPVDLAVKHALQTYESRHPFFADIIVLLYGNVPVRTADITDRAVGQLITTGADSVRSVTPVGKLHPDWMHHLEGGRLRQFRKNHIDRRQNLEPLYFHDGAVVAMSRASLLAEPQNPDDHLAFFGINCHAVVQEPHDTVDVDTIADLYYAEALLRYRTEEVFFGGAAVAGRKRNGRYHEKRQPVLTGAVVTGRCGRR
ncbi:MAG: acylneuraminate cytidylyltransferase family protein [Phycisphaerales bacterium]|nr:MAG: acylneuraminate cytidylyltransferase family protein [Phycisphaerales bacterium]